MLLLLPPSEGKTPAAPGAPPVDLGALSHPALTEHRSRVLAALACVSAAPDALTVLGAGPSLAADVHRNVTLATEPAGPATDVYSGVLYAAAGLSRLGPRARDRAAEHVRVVSGLWGLVAPGDRIPAYRLSMATDLPGVGPLAASWRGPLGRELDGPARERMVVDCRSADYLAAWRPPRDAACWVPVRVLRELDGRRSVVSHSAKHTRGVLARHVLTRRGLVPGTPSALLRAARELVGSELLAADLEPRPSGGAVLTLVVGPTTAGPARPD